MDEKLSCISQQHYSTTKDIGVNDQPIKKARIGEPIRDGARREIYYGYSHNGGLIFHNSGVENLTVRLGTDSNPWGIHT